MDYLTVIAFVGGVVVGILGACFALFWCAVVDLGRELENMKR